MKTNKLQQFLIIIIVFLVGYYFGTSQVQFSWDHYKPNIHITNKEPVASSANVDFSLFWTVWDKLYSSYYDRKALDPQNMVYGAISGMVQSVGDPYTMFLPPSQNANFQDQLAGQFGGIGAELGLDGKQIVVIAPLDDSPAQKAGIKAGDAIFKVDQESTATWTLPKTVEKIRGPKGTKVTLTVLHKGDKATRDIEIIRDTIKVKSVDGWIKKVQDINTIHDSVKKSDKGQDAVMYIRLSQFGNTTNQDWEILINKLVDQMKKTPQFKGAILDLRNNPGGILNDATFIAGEFLPENTTVVIEDKGHDDTTTFTVTRAGKLVDVPLVVLVNKGSASASEIVAGTLRDQRKIKLIGETTFGKGTVQEAVDLKSGTSVHITVAKWLTPNGTWVNGKGLTPDISVQLDDKDQDHDQQLEKAIEELVK